MRSCTINLNPNLAPGLREQHYRLPGGVEFTLRTSHDRTGVVAVMTMGGQYRIGEKEAALGYLSQMIGRTVEVVGPVRG